MPERPLTWSASEAGSFERPLDGLESFFVMLNNASPVNEHWAISVGLRLGFPSSLASKDPTPYLKDAWLAVCRRHPALTGSLDSRGTGTVLVVDPFTASAAAAAAAADGWLSRTFSTHHQHESDLFSVLRNTQVPTCHWVPATQEVHLRCQHWRIDGIGMLMLADSFVSALATVVRAAVDADPELHHHHHSHPSNGGEGLTPSLYSLAPSLGQEEPSTVTRCSEAADALVAEFLRGFPSIALPTTPGSEASVPGDSAREAVTLSPDETAGVIAACKSRGVHVASAVHAALIKVTATYPQHPLAKSYACFFPVDVRRHLPAAQRSVEYVVNNFCSGLPLCVPEVAGGQEGEGKTFDEILAHTNTAYTSDLARPRPDDKGTEESEEKPRIGMVRLVEPYLQRTTKLFATPPPPGLPPVQNPDLSTLGKIDGYLRCEYACAPGEAIQVTGFWLGTQMQTRSLQCHAWTFRDELTIQGCFNQSFYTRAFVADVLGKVKAELLGGLRVH